MLRRLTLGFAALTTALAVVACSSSDTKAISVGPNFPTASLYASNSSQNGVSIYPPNTASGSGPVNQIGGSSTTLNGPQYLAFDSSSNLWITNFANGSGSIVEIKALATGNVLPLLNSANQGIAIARPRGLAFGQQALASGSSTFLAVANVNPAAAAGTQNQLLFFNPGFFGTAYQTIAGSNTGLNVPSGVAADTKGHVYVANLQGASVAQFTVPTPTPSVSPTATPTATPTPTPTPPGATPSPTPTPVPTATPLNLAPTLLLSGSATGIGQPTSVALDGSGNIYVSDQASTLCGTQPCGAILVFAPSATGNVAPIRSIFGSATKLFAPSDVKVDGSGKIYVADSTSGGAGVLYVFAAAASGNVAPSTTFTSPGAVIGIGLAP